MEFIFTGFIWLIAIIIIYYTLKWRKEKQERMTISKKGMKKYNRKPMTASIGEILKYKNRIAKK